MSDLTDMGFTDECEDPPEDDSDKHEDFLIEKDNRFEQDRQNYEWNQMHEGYD